MDRNLTNLELQNQIKNKQAQPTDEKNLQKVGRVRGAKEKRFTKEEEERLRYLYGYSDWVRVGERDRKSLIEEEKITRNPLLI